MARKARLKVGCRKTPGCESFQVAHAKLAPRLMREEASKADPAVLSCMFQDKAVRVLRQTHARIGCLRWMDGWVDPTRKWYRLDAWRIELSIALTATVGVVLVLFTLE